MLALLAQQIPDRRIAAAVDTVFHDPAYQRLTLGQAVWHWFESLLLRALGSVFRWYSQLRASPVLFWTLLLIVAALVAAIVVRAVVMWRWRHLDVAGGAVWRGMRGAGRDDPWTAAETLAAAGDYTSAAHALYAAMLESAARQQQIRLHPSKTVGDYVRELRTHSSSLFTRFREFGRSYEVVIYGIGTCDAARYHQLYALAVPVVRPNG
jgi:molybdopterin converting factor small subunit